MLLLCASVGFIFQNKLSYIKGKYFNYAVRLGLWMLYCMPILIQGEFTLTHIANMCMFNYRFYTNADAFWLYAEKKDNVRIS